MNKTGSKYCLASLGWLLSSSFMSPLSAADDLTLLTPNVSIKKQAVTQTPSPFEVHGYINAGFAYDIGAKGNVTLDYQQIPLHQVGGDAGSTGFSGFHVKQSRINVKTIIDTPLGELTGFIEGDFDTNEGNERLTNSSGFRVRHAYSKIGDWLAGQYWSTFVDAGAYPESIELGNAASQALIRQTQLRYSHDLADVKLMVSIENPETDFRPTSALYLTHFNGEKVTIVNQDRYPDLVFRSVLEKPWGHVSLQYVHRTLSSRIATEQIINLPIDSSAANVAYRDISNKGYAVALSAKINTVGKDDMRVYLATGDGAGRYIQESTNLAAVVFMPNSAQALLSLDQINQQFQLETNQSYGGYVAYRHWWNDSWRSNFSVGFTRIDADEVNQVDASLLARSESYNTAFANIIWQASQAWSVGVEFLWAERYVEADNIVGKQIGEYERLQLSIKYQF